MEWMNLSEQRDDTFMNKLVLKDMKQSVYWFVSKDTKNRFNLIRDMDQIDNMIMKNWIDDDPESRAKEVVYAILEHTMEVVLEQCSNDLLSFLNCCVCDMKRVLVEHIDKLKKKDGAKIDDIKWSKLKKTNKNKMYILKMVNVNKYIQTLLCRVIGKLYKDVEEDAMFDDSEKATNALETQILNMNWNQELNTLHALEIELTKLKAPKGKERDDTQDNGMDEEEDEDDVTNDRGNELSKFKKDIFSMIKKQHLDWRAENKKDWEQIMHRAQTLDTHNVRETEITSQDAALFIDTDHSNTSLNDMILSSSEATARLIEQNPRINLQSLAQHIQQGM